jgi:hypothetical protein
MPDARICSVEGCGNRVEARGLCKKHHLRLLRHGDVNYISRIIKPKETRSCGVEGCEEPHKAHGFCNKHYRRYLEHGDPLFGEKPSACSVEECDNPVKAKGLCATHYMRLLRRGTLELSRTENGAGLQFVLKALQYDGDDCLFWPFPSNRYAMIFVDGKAIGAHRYVCEQVNGPPPTPEHQAAHSCGKGHLGCLTPHHLSWKTAAENQGDRLIHGTHSRGSQNHFAVLNEDEAREAKRLIEMGVPYAMIADQFGVTVSAISAIAREATWWWVE